MYTLTYTYMYITNNTFSVTDLRHKTLEVLREVKNSGYVHLVSRSKTEAAIVDIDYLNALQEAYEDQMDIKEYDETIGLKRIPLEVHLKKYAGNKKSK